MQVISLIDLMMWASSARDEKTQLGVHTDEKMQLGVHTDEKTQLGVHTMISKKA